LALPRSPAGARGGARGGGRPPGVVQRATCAVVIAGAWPLLGPARPATRRVDAVSVCVGRFVTLAPPPLPRKGARGGGRPPGVVQRATCAVAIAGARPLSGPALPATRRENAVSVCVTRPVRDFAPPPLPAGARKP
jgi:hypothetical protein